MPGVQFVNVNWEQEEVKAMQGHMKRREQRRRRNESKKKLRMEIEGANQFLQFLFRIKEDLLRMLLEESVHAFAFFMIVYDSRGDDEIIDRFLKRDMTAESLQRSELYMLLEWRQACIADGVFKIESNLEFESRQDISSVGRRQ